MMDQVDNARVIGFGQVYSQYDLYYLAVSEANFVHALPNTYIYQHFNI